MKTDLYNNYIEILKSELVVALGCTEPIAIAYAAAKAREVLGAMPTSISIASSGNIIKNVKGVTVPNSGGLKGVEIAAILGVVGGDAKEGLEVLQGITDAHRATAKELLAGGYCTCSLIKNESNLFVRATAYKGKDSAVVEIKNKHTNIVKIMKNEEVIFSTALEAAKSGAGNKDLLNVKDILDFAQHVELSLIQDLIQQQIQINSEISNEGLTGDYGVSVGKTLLKYDGASVKNRAKAAAAAGSDARMSGCSLPVVINSGSGNQGLTVSMPVIVYAKELGVSDEKLYRALAAANLTAILQKKYIGSLSAYCGAVSAACGSAVGIAYLNDASYEQISQTITNTLANIGGMVCDGAKPSCAAKIASAVDSAIMGYQMSCEGKAFQYGEGLVKSDVEKTIASIGRMGKDGMKETDIEILNIMLEN